MDKIGTFWATRTAIGYLCSGLQNEINLKKKFFLFMNMVGTIFATRTSIGYSFLCLKIDFKLEKKSFFVIFLSMVGTFCAICTATGDPCLYFTTSKSERKTILQQGHVVFKLVYSRSFGSESVRFSRGKHNWY